jgi:hypothetical protein
LVAIVSTQPSTAPLGNDGKATSQDNTASGLAAVAELPFLGSATVDDDVSHRFVLAAQFEGKRRHPSARPALTLYCTAIIDRYQEQPQLLDPYLGSFLSIFSSITKITNAYHSLGDIANTLLTPLRNHNPSEGFADPVLYNLLFRLLYHVCKVG